MQHKKTANDLLMNTVENTKTDVIVLITEPYISKKTNLIPGVSQDFEQYHMGYGSVSAIVARKTISQFRLTEFETNKLTAIKVNADNSQMIVLASLYCPRGEDPISEEVKELVSKELKPGTKGIIGLDANAHSVLVGYDKSDKRAQEWEEFIIETNLSLHNKKHANTFENSRGFKSIIDWTISTDGIANSVENWTVREDIETLSDHKWVAYEILEKPRLVEERRRNYHKVNWEEYCTELRQALNRKTANNDEKQTTENIATKITEAITQTTEKLVPLTKKTRYRNKWWTGDLQKLKKAYKKAKKGSDRGNKIRAQIEYETAISKAKQEAWRKFLESVEGQNEVYVKYKILCNRKKKADIPSIKVNGNYTKTFEESVRELNKVNFPDIQRPLSEEHQTIEEEVEQYFIPFSHRLLELRQASGKAAFLPSIVFTSNFSHFFLRYRRSRECTTPADLR